VNQGSTVTMSGMQILKQKKLTIGMDLGERSTRYSVLGEAGDRQIEQIAKKEYPRTIAQTVNSGPKLVFPPTGARPGNACRRASS
jgi:hypothetical protein